MKPLQDEKGVVGYIQKAMFNFENYVFVSFCGCLGPYFLLFNTYFNTPNENCGVFPNPRSVNERQDVKIICRIKTADAGDFGRFISHCFF